MKWVQKELRKQVSHRVNFILEESSYKIYRRLGGVIALDIDAGHSEKTDISEDFKNIQMPIFSGSIYLYTLNFSSDTPMSSKKIHSVMDFLIDLGALASNFNLSFMDFKSIASKTLDQSSESYFSKDKDISYIWENKEIKWSNLSCSHLLLEPLFLEAHEHHIFCPHLMASTVHTNLNRKIFTRFDSISSEKKSLSEIKNLSQFTIYIEKIEELSDFHQKDILKILKTKTKPLFITSSAKSYTQLLNKDLVSFELLAALSKNYVRLKHFPKELSSQEIHKRFFRLFVTENLVVN